MADYAVRVELRGYPSAEEYQTLHSLMARKGFAQTIAGVDAQGTQKRFNLPHAVYYGSSVADCRTVRDSIIKSVKSEVQTDIIVFVVQAQTWTIGS
jgi:hypothetical protein